MTAHSLLGIGYVIFDLLILRKVGTFVDYVEQLADVDVKLDLHSFIELLKQVLAVVNLTIPSVL
jgi:hypothetical protein